MIASTFTGIGTYSRASYCTILPTYSRASYSTILPTCSTGIIAICTAGIGTSTTTRICAMATACTAIISTATALVFTTTSTARMATILTPTTTRTQSNHLQGFINFANVFIKFKNCSKNFIITTNTLMTFSFQSAIQTFIGISNSIFKFF